jgi:hypothetical protein
MNYVCSSNCSIDVFDMREDIYDLHTKYGVTFTKYNSFSMNVTVGYNLYTFPSRMFYFKNSFLILYQQTGLVAINSTGSSPRSDFTVYGDPYDYLTTAIEPLDSTGNTNQTFYIRVYTNEISPPFGNKSLRRLNFTKMLFIFN